MSHEIYYTSAPEGLRPGQSGFCTVATTEGIPRPLWDRLESVSGYRHQYTAGSGGRNPVAYAHWLLAVQGRELSVLSRICDAGLDYTQRTNAFAHHVAVEPSERAAAGPAWMLLRPGLMATRWDGQVGPIRPASRLPTGDQRPAPCTAWQRAAGDAGWGGVLAEAGMKHPRRPVCILFAPDQDVLPLIAEAIALLPANKRWDVTFNTYFTGLPGNAVCAWRCCLAGTPAAADAVRHAGGGLVLDLTRAGGLGAPAAGAWVEAARTGQPPADSIALTPRRAAAPRAMPATAVEAEPIEIAAFEVAAAEPRRVSTVFDDLETASREMESPGPSRAVDTSWIDQRQRSRRFLLLGVTAVALLFIAAGVWLRNSAQQATAERALTPSTSEQEEPIIPEPDLPLPDPPQVKKVEPPRPAPPTMPSTREITLVKPLEPTPPKPLPPPASIQLATEVLPPATTGAALRAPTQSITIPSDQFVNLPAVASFRIAFPDKSEAYTYRQKDLAGVLTAESSGGFRHQLIWRDDANRAVPVEVAMISLEPSGEAATLEIAWRMKALLNRPEVISLVRVLLHNADLVVADSANRRPQYIRFKTPEPIDVNLDEPTTKLALSTLPDAMCRIEKTLPGGWTMTWISGPATRTAGPKDADVGVMSFTRKNITGGEPTRFALRVGPRWSVLVGDFAAQREAALRAVAVAADAVAKADQEVARLREGQRFATEETRKRIAEANAQLKLSDADLANRFTNKPSLRELIKNERLKLDQMKAGWEGQIEEAAQKREPAIAARAAATRAREGFALMKDVQIRIELPGKLQVATLRLNAGEND